VNDVHVIGLFFRKLALLALTGFLFVTLIGPFLAIVGVLIGFAAVGLLVWIPVRILVLKKPINWGQLRDTGRKCGGVVVSGCNRIGGGAMKVRGVVWNHGQAFFAGIYSAVLLVAAVFRETFCGAVVGALLGILRGSPGSFPWESLIWGISVGAAVGALVGVTSRFSAPRRVQGDEIVHA
jgi:hypothetical protein